MKKIAFLTRSLQHGGAQRQLVTLAKTLDRGSFEPSVICYYPGGQLVPELSTAGIDVVMLDKQGRWDFMGFFLRLVRHLRRSRPDILHSYLSTSNILAVMLKLFCPATRMVWGVRTSSMDLAQYDWSFRVSVRLESWLSRFADLIIVNSYAGRDDHIAIGFPPDKLLVIHNGIDTDRFQPDPAAGQRQRAAWGVPEHCPLIGLAARLDPMKGHPQFLQAAALLSQQQADIRFVCAGFDEKGYESEMRSLADTLGLSDRIIWAGDCRDMYAFYNALTISTSSSAFGEGFSNAIGEAMACGVPCVVTDVGDSALIVGDTGEVVPVADPAALALGWGTLLQRLQAAPSALPQAVRTRIVTQFSHRVLAQKTSSALLRLC